METNGGLHEGMFNSLIGQNMRHAAWFSKLRIGEFDPEVWLFLFGSRFLELSGQKIRFFTYFYPLIIGVAPTTLADRGKD
jgi:hypothetical protein